MLLPLIDANATNMLENMTDFVLLQFAAVVFSIVAKLYCFN